ncbi:branched-chain amino acid ABC transporter permease [Deltaproteobacteria bacterium Smac51]|nr:branched-chain amino acid ABC transporter permease [Deltaproteobacteria bacterium Smac51]
MSDESNRSSSFTAGLATGCPIVMGLVPIGLVYGAAAGAMGLSLIQTVGMSLTIYSGSSQLVFLDMWGQGASTLVLTLTCLVMNLRMGMYGASLAPRLGEVSGARSAAAAYLITDESYGLSMGHFLSRKAQPASPLSFYFGAALPTWISWQLSGLAGHLVGALIPPSWPLNMAVPLVFLALLVPMLARGPKLSAAAAAMITAVAGAGIPMNLGLILAVAVGIAAGMIHSSLSGKAA